MTFFNNYDKLYVGTITPAYKPEKLMRRLASGAYIYDTQTDLREFTGSLIPKSLEIKGDRYEYEMDMLLEFVRNGVPIKEKRAEFLNFSVEKST